MSSLLLAGITLSSKAKDMKMNEQQRKLAQRLCMLPKTLLTGKVKQYQQMSGSGKN